jgi:hypothetical protein
MALICLGMAEQGEPMLSKTPGRAIRRPIIVATVLLCALVVGGGLFPSLIGTASGMSALSGHGNARTSSGPSAFLGYNVSFTETGLPYHTAWSVTFNGVVHGASRGTITVPEVPNGTYAWNVTSFATLYPTPSSGNITVAGGLQNQPIAFATLPGRYTVTFTETGLPFGTAWGVTFNSSFYASAGYMGTVTINNVVNGNYSWNVSSFVGLTPTPPSGSIMVNGANFRQAITFAAPPGTYTVTFDENGLPFGTTWTVTFNGVNHASTFGGIITINAVGNGSYPWNTSITAGLYPHPPSGNLGVNGGPVTQTVNFTASLNLFTVTFSETGLFGTAWSVTFNNAVYKSAAYGGNIVIDNVTNGSYAWNVTPVSGYTATPPSGSLTVNGNNAAQAIVFTAITGVYAVTFTELGLAPGTTWSVTFNGSTSSSATAIIGVGSFVDGNYSFSVGSVTGYTSAPSSGTVTVSRTGLLHNP